MGITRLSIKDFLLGSEGNLVLDVRSPSEFSHAHIPSAISLPLFSDEERKLVGTSYKQESREKAIKIGLDFFGPKMKRMVEEVEQLYKQSFGYQKTDDSENDLSPVSKNLFIYCWRGGMRSAAVAWLMNLYGFRVYTLAGGYKSFRNYVLKSFDEAYPIKIVGGYTGSGKTEVLSELKNQGEKILDLEAIACHKGSAFGSFNMPKPPSQEMFENMLSIELGKVSLDSKEVWVEDESQRIGNLNIPNALWATMRSSPVFFLEVPFEERLKHIVEEYKTYEREKLVDSVQRISKRLGPLETKTTLEWLEKGEFTEAFRILLHYYDKLYLKGLHNRENLSALLTRIKCETVTPENALMLTKYQPA